MQNICYIPDFSLPLHRQPFGAVDLNESISTFVDDGNAVHGDIRVDFCRELFGLPAFLLLLVVFLKLLFCDELVYIIVLVDEERVCLLYIVFLAIV